MLTLGSYLQDRYEILEQIGSGGMSYVYKAQCHKLKRPVAIKVLKEEFASDQVFVEKFKMEAQAAARLSHPNIVNVYDVVDEGELHYIVMELIDGITLKKYIEKKGQLETREAIGISIQVAQGIAAAHEHHIIHRDIKPQNMIISRDGKVKVADFGIARAVSTQTAGAQAVGSVHYISPEQAMGEMCDERSDIYSFGITMYEMVTGKVPFDGENTVSVALGHLGEPLTPPSQHNPDVGLALEQIILKCTQKKPDRRYSSMEDVINDLRKALVNPESDILGAVNPALEEFGQTKTMSQEEYVKIQEGSRMLRRQQEEEVQEEVQTAAAEEPEPGKKGGSRKVRGQKPGKKGGSKGEGKEDVSAQFDRIVTVFGIVAALLIVAVVLFVFTRLGGLFNVGSGNRQPQVPAVQESTSGAEVAITDDQTSMPNVLSLPQDMAEAKLKDSSLVMQVTGSQYSDNYDQGQVMAQDVLAGTAVAKWSTVGVTISMGSDKVKLTGLNLISMNGQEAKELLEEKGLTVEIKQEYSDTAAKDTVIRFSPETARVGDSATLYTSRGPQPVEGRVPNMLGQSREAAEAMLAAAGLQPGNVTLEPNAQVAEGLVITQLVLPDTVLPKGSSVDFTVSSGAEGQTEDDGKYYLGSIDTTCSLSNYIGPASQTSSVRVTVRLKQKAGNEETYVELIPPHLIVGSQTIPISFSKIKGIYGVDTGEVEVVDAGTNTVIQSFPISFFPAG